MSRACLRAILLVFVTGCTAGTTSSGAAESAGFHIVSIERQVKDSASPVGYWEISLAYPQLKPVKTSAADSVNKQVTALVEKHSCRGPGDQTFTAKPVYGNGRVLSFYYEAMWMCQTMPSPDSSSGIANFNLETGASFSVESEFLDGEARKRFLASANNALDEKVKRLPKDEAGNCVPFQSAANALVSPQGIELKGIGSRHGVPDCPVSVLVPRKELPSFFRADSVLLQQ